MSKRATNCCQSIADLVPPELFRTLCDPNRVEILARLAACRVPCTVGELAECCPVDLSVVSRHLSTLRAAGIVRNEKRGRNVYYSIQVDSLVGVLRRLADALEQCCPPEKGDEP